MGRGGVTVPFPFWFSIGLTTAMSPSKAPGAMLQASWERKRDESKGYKRRPRQSSQGRADTLLQMKSFSDGSSSPTYSTIFLLIQGPTLFSINVYRKEHNCDHNNINISCRVKQSSVKSLGWDYLSKGDWCALTRILSITLSICSHFSSYANTSSFVVGMLLTRFCTIFFRSSLVIFRSS